MKGAISNRQKVFVLCLRNAWQQTDSWIGSECSGTYEAQYDCWQKFCIQQENYEIKIFDLWSTFCVWRNRNSLICFIYHPAARQEGFDYHGLVYYYTAQK